jgi:hypothetical protein
MKKSEAEPMIRRLVQDWAHETGFRPESGDHPSFSTFTTWIDQKGYSLYLRFRSVRGPLEDAEQWFDEILHQTWRN